ncbi:hypothetical protein BVX94_00835 [bacterium B17]|nr:hypothetical protein BVX94_00835 [bacterium B17]
MGYEGELYLTEGAGATGKSQSDLLESGDGLSGFDIRILWWKNAMGEMAKKPIKYLSGLGLGGFIYYSQFDNTVTSPEVNSYHLSFFYDIGIIGTFLYLILVTQLTAYLLKAFRTDTNNYMRIVLIAATTAMVADTVIYGLIDNDLTSHGARYFWIPIAFVVAIARLILNKKKDTTPIKEI